MITRHAIIIDGAPALISGRWFTDPEGTRHPLTADRAHKLALGVHEVEGHGPILTLDGDVVRASHPPAPDPELPTPEQMAALVNAERDRRLQAPFEFQGKLYQRDTISLQRITGAATLAGFAVGAGAQPGDYLWHGGDTPFGWIAADDTVTLMDAPTAFAFGQAAAEVETRLIFRAKALREADPVPEDYADDRWWG